MIDFTVNEPFIPYPLLLLSFPFRIFILQILTVDGEFH